MDRVRGLLTRLSLVDALSLGLIAFILALALSYWHKFPVHMDSFYHMGVTAGYARAGGIALHSFWEYAPAGRAQLYPPLLHVFMFATGKTGLSMVTVGRLTSFAAFPLILLSSWHGMRALFSGRAAFYTTVVLSSCYLLFWHSAVESAAALVLILAPLVFVAVDRDRKVAAAILLALALYSHLTLGHLVALGLLIYAVHRRELFKRIAVVLAGAYLLWLPWGIHILMNKSALSVDTAGTSGGVTVHILVWLVALAGFVYCYFKKEKYYLLPSFLLGFVPIVFFYPDRFWNAHVFVPLAMLGGVALSATHGFLGEKIAELKRNRTASRAALAALMAVPVALLLFLDPVYAKGGSAGGGPGGQPPGQRLAVQALQSGQAQQPVANSGQSAANATNGSSNPPGFTTNGNAGGPTQGPPPLPNGTGTAQPPAMGQPNCQAGPGAPGMPGMQGAPGAAGGAGGQGAGGGPGMPGGSTGFKASATTVLSLLGRSTATGQQSLGSSALIDSDTLKMAALVKASTTADQVVYCADGSIGNLITGLTGRASTSGMFHEVRSQGQSGADASAASVLVVSGGRQAAGAPAASAGTYGTNSTTAQGTSIAGLQQGTAGMAGPTGQSNIDLTRYELVGTAGQYTVYRNKSATAVVGGHGTVIPWAVVFALLALALAAAAIDWFRPAFLRRGKPRPSGGGRVESGMGVNGTDAHMAGAGDPGKGVLAIVPCHNEVDNAGGVVREIREVAPFIDVLVVDDGSTDGTSAAAAGAGATVITHGRNAGIGAAVRTGMSYALARGYEYAVQVDGDGQHDAGYVRCLLGTLEADLADIVIGSRFLGTRGYKPPLARRAGTRLLSGVVTAATGQRATDTTSGFRAMNRRALAFLVENYPDDFPESETLVLMSQAGIRWKEVPVSMRGRANGVSSIRGAAAARFMVKVVSRIARDAATAKLLNKPVYSSPDPRYGRP